MVIRGVYTKEEEEMLAEWRERTDKLVGWLGETFSEQVSHPVVNRVATKELITRLAYASDYRNPLWRDESYARNTRWGGIIAPPFFQQTISLAGQDVYLRVPPEVGVDMPFLSTPFAGDYWEFFKPIYVNDSFRVWMGRPSIDDVTPLDEKAPRKFRIMSKASYINQRDEVTAIFSRLFFTAIYPPGTKKVEMKVEFTKEYVYTREEIEAIDRAFAAEEIRGANTRYWEDVNIGDELRPVVWGPLTTYDMLVDMQSTAIAVFPTMQMRSVLPNAAYPIDPVTNIPHMAFEFHLTERAAQMSGNYSTTIVSNSVEHFLGRLITNWMGDDGFLRRFNYLKLVNTPLGDTIIGRGKVIKKYIDADGDHVVDLDVWMETIRGYVSNAVAVTVSLVSREEAFQ